MLGGTSRIFLILFLILLPASVNAALVNINTATLEELDTLPGVGPATVQSIINNRPYATIQEISRADGIGEPGSPSYENIIGLITVGDSNNSSVEAGETLNSISIEQGSSAPTYSEVKSTVTFIKLDIGRDRTGSVGNPILFKANVNLSNVQKGDFRWNFGDGSEGYGTELFHAYEYPGEYVVILTLGSVGGESARVNVRIIDPEFSVIKATPERIEIKNNSKYEANLSGRTLLVGDSSFVFLSDTFIKPGSSISFSSKVTNLFPTDASAVSIITVGHVEQSKLRVKIEEEKSKQAELIRNKISNLQNQIAILAPVPRPVVSTVIINPTIHSASSSVAAVLEAISPISTEKKSWLQTLKLFFLRTK